MKNTEPSISQTTLKPTTNNMLQSCKKLPLYQNQSTGLLKELLTQFKIKDTVDHVGLSLLPPHQKELGKSELEIQFYYHHNNQLIAQNGISDVKEETLFQPYNILKTTVLNHGLVTHISQEPPKKLVHANTMNPILFSKTDQFGVLPPKTQLTQLKLLLTNQSLSLLMLLLLISNYTKKELCPQLDVELN